MIVLLAFLMVMVGEKQQRERVPRLTVQSPSPGKSHGISQAPHWGIASASILGRMESSMQAALHSLSSPSTTRRATVPKQTRKIQDTFSMTFQDGHYYQNR